MPATGATGTLLKVGDGSTTEVFTTVPGVSKLTAPQVKFDLVDVTSHDSTGGFREFLPGLCDGDNVTAEVNWDLTDETHQSLQTDAGAKTKRNFEMVFPTGTPGNKCSFAGYVTGIAITANIGEAIKATLTIKVTGKPTWT